MSIESKHESLASSPETPASNENQESARDIESRYVEMVLSGELANEFSKRFSSDVLNVAKEKRSEALTSFKADYINKKMKLAEVLQQSKLFFNKENRPTIESFSNQVSLDELTQQEKDEVLAIANKLVERSETLRLVIFGKDYSGDEELNPDDASALFHKLTKEWPKDEDDTIYVTKHGDILIFHVNTDDLATLYALDTTGEEKQARMTESRSAGGFFKKNCKLKFEEEDLESLDAPHSADCNIIAINKDALFITDDIFAAEEKVHRHEIQHAIYNMLYRYTVHGKKIENKQDAIGFINDYLAAYLESVRDEVIAYAVEGEEIIAEHFNAGGMYDYLDTIALERLKSTIGDEKFQSWGIQEHWHKKALPRYRQKTEEMISIANRLAKHNGPKREKLIALFEIEPPDKWSRLHKWLQDPEIRSRVDL